MALVRRRHDARYGIAFHGASMAQRGLRHDGRALKGKPMAHGRAPLGLSSWRAHGAWRGTTG